MHKLELEADHTAVSGELSTRSDYHWQGRGVCITPSSRVSTVLKRNLVIDDDKKDKSNNGITKPQPSREPPTPIFVSFLAVAGW